MKLQLKKKLFSFLVWLLNKLDPRAIITGQFLYQDKIEVGFKKYVPADGTWHYVQLQFSCWLLNGHSANASIECKDKIILDCATVIQDEKAEEIDPGYHLERTENPGMEEWTNEEKRNE